MKNSFQKTVLFVNLFWGVGFLYLSPQMRAEETSGESGIPRILASPRGVSVPSGRSARLTVQAAGAPPLHYQWQMNGQNLPGENLASITLDNVQVTQSLQCVVSNALGQVVSAPAVIQIKTPPTIRDLWPSNKPRKLIVDLGEPVRLTVDGRGEAPLEYQWFRDGKKIEGATFGNLEIPKATVDIKGIYRCRISNPSGSTFSRPMTVVVRFSPTILQQTGNISTVLGERPKLMVKADGIMPLRYQWQRRKNNEATFSDIPGARASTYRVPVLAESDAGTVYRCVIKNEVGTTKSGEIVLQINSLSASANSELTVFPNPFIPSKGHSLVQFINVAAFVPIRIYSITGELVREFQSDGSGTAQWNGKNISNEAVGSGVYFVHVGNEKEKNIVKLVVVR